MLDNAWLLNRTILGCSGGAYRVLKVGCSMAGADCPYFNSKYPNSRGNTPTNKKTKQPPELEGDKCEIVPIIHVSYGTRTTPLLLLA